MKFRREIGDLEIIPRGYGKAYYRDDFMVAVCYPIPLNLIVQVARNLYWFLVKFHPTKVDRLLREAYLRGNRAKLLTRYRHEGKIKIITNGIPVLTRIIDMETGEEIHGIARVSIDIFPDRIDAVLHARDVAVELEMSRTIRTDVRGGGVPGDNYGVEYEGIDSLSAGEGAEPKKGD
jgi:hypothetical protein